MSGTDVVGASMLGLVAVVAAIAATDARAEGGDQSFREELDKLAQRSIFFGHQSVGANILDGLRKLAAREGVTLRLVELPGAAAIPQGTFAHGLIEENGNPGLNHRRKNGKYFSKGPGSTTCPFARPSRGSSRGYRKNRLSGFRRNT